MKVWVIGVAILAACVGSADAAIQSMGERSLAEGPLLFVPREAAGEAGSPEGAERLLRAASVELEGTGRGARAARRAGALLARALDASRRDGDPVLVRVLGELDACTAGLDQPAGDTSAGARADEMACLKWALRLTVLLEDGGAVAARVCAAVGDNATAYVHADARPVVRRARAALALLTGQGGAAGDSAMETAALVCVDAAEWHALRSEGTAAAAFASQAFQRLTLTSLEKQQQQQDKKKQQKKKKNRKNQKKEEEEEERAAKQEKEKRRAQFYFAQGALQAGECGIALRVVNALRQAYLAEDLAAQGVARAAELRYDPAGERTPAAVLALYGLAYTLCEPAAHARAAANLRAAAEVAAAHTPSAALGCPAGFTFARGLGGLVFDGSENDVLPEVLTAEQEQERVKQKEKEKEKEKEEKEQEEQDETEETEGNKNNKRDYIVIVNQGGDPKDRRGAGDRSRFAEALPSEAELERDQRFGTDNRLFVGLPFAARARAGKYARPRDAYVDKRVAVVALHGVHVVGAGGLAVRGAPQCRVLEPDAQRLARAAQELAGLSGARPVVHVPGRVASVLGLGAGLAMEGTDGSMGSVAMLARLAVLDAHVLRAHPDVRVLAPATPAAQRALALYGLDPARVLPYNDSAVLRFDTLYVVDQRLRASAGGAEADTAEDGGYALAADAEAAEDVGMTTGSGENSVDAWLPTYPSQYALRLLRKHVVERTGSAAAVTRTAEEVARTDAAWQVVVLAPARGAVRAVPGEVQRRVVARLRALVGREHVAVVAHARPAAEHAARMQHAVVALGPHGGLWAAQLWMPRGACVLQYPVRPAGPMAASYTAYALRHTYHETCSFVSPFFGNYSSPAAAEAGRDVLSADDVDTIVEDIVAAATTCLRQVGLQYPFSEKAVQDSIEFEKKNKKAQEKVEL